MARLEVSGLAGGYPGMTVFSGVGFTVESGRILTILGANGSGKSALLATVQGLLPRAAGSILLDGEPVHDLPPEARATRGMSLVSDRRWLWKEMTVSEHLRVGAFRQAARPGWRRRARELRAVFTGLPERNSVRPAGLSGGLQQQLALARFGMSAPGVWLLDDPLQGLDDAMARRVLAWIRDAAGSGAAVLLTGQHIEMLLEVAGEAMFLDEGSLDRLPTGQEGMADPRVRRLL